jgi:carbonic anhydrase
VVRELDWEDAISRQSNERSRSSLAALWEGHRRFLASRTQARNYEQPILQSLAASPNPIAAVVACSDSRVAPEILFDRGLGDLFVSRVPGNVASDGTKWMLEIAVTELKVPLVIVVGHTGCLAIAQSVEGRTAMAGGTLRYDVARAVDRARMSHSTDLYFGAVRENVLLTLENLRRESYATQNAIRDGTLGLVGAVYDMPSGVVTLIDS